MAHALAKTADGRDMMAYFGEAPWHGLGTVLDSPATSVVAMEASGLGWTVGLEEIRTASGLAIPGRMATVRSDTSAPLGVVSTGYRVVQNHEAFGFLDALVADGSLRYHTAGGLGRGERVWMLAKLPGEIQVKKTQDISEKYLLLTNSHDGSQALRVFFTPVRVVCQNTLNLALRRGAADGVSIRHFGDVHARIDEARRVLGLASKAFDDYAGQVDVLAKTRVTQSQLRSFFLAVYPEPEGDPDQAESTQQSAAFKAARTAHERLLDRLASRFERGLGNDMPGIRGTAWAALNAVTEEVDHGKAERLAEFGPESREYRAGREQRFRHVLTGDGAKTKARALGAALALAN